MLSRKLASEAQRFGNVVVVASRSRAIASRGQSFPRHARLLMLLPRPGTRATRGQLRAAATCPSLETTATVKTSAERSSSDAGCWSTASLEVILGPMFAGKTSLLLSRIQSQEISRALLLQGLIVAEGSSAPHLTLQAAGNHVLVAKSDKDTRYGISHMKSHDGKAKACYAVAELSQLEQQWPQEYHRAQVIVVDEAQFFPDLREFCTKAVDEDNKDVIVAGLSGDFNRKPFGQVLEVIPLADTVSKLSSECRYCSAGGTQNSAALFSLRIVADQRQEVVGGAEKYAPVCRHHYKELSKVRSPDSGLAEAS